MTKRGNRGNSKDVRLNATLNAQLERNLTHYMAAAASAGVALLAASPAEARIVYTAANLSFSHNGSVELDLNNDGIPDFKLFDFYSQPIRVPLGYRENDLEIIARTYGNQVCEVQSNGQKYVAALPARVQVGSGCKLFSALGSQVLAFSAGSYSTAAVKGPWSVRPNAYLGVKFLIHGIAHYGWVRISVAGNIENVTVVGYAYETVPNKSISTGQVSGPIEVGESSWSSSGLDALAVQPSLGILARGAEFLVIWRRPDETATGGWSEARA
jgi:hypothetical protein